jgi:hypothetical protein
LAGALCIYMSMILEHAALIGHGGSAERNHHFNAFMMSSLRFIGLCLFRALPTMTQVIFNPRKLECYVGMLLWVGVEGVKEARQGFGLLRSCVTPL